MKMIQQLNSKCERKKKRGMTTKKWQMWSEPFFNIEWKKVCMVHLCKDNWTNMAWYASAIIMPSAALAPASGDANDKKAKHTNTRTLWRNKQEHNKLQSDFYLAFNMKCFVLSIFFFLSFSFAKFIAHETTRYGMDESVRQNAAPSLQWLFSFIMLNYSADRCAAFSRIIRYMRLSVLVLLKYVECIASLRLQSPYNTNKVDCCYFSLICQQVFMLHTT